MQFTQPADLGSLAVLDATAVCLTQAAATYQKPSICLERRDSYAGASNWLVMREASRTSEWSALRANTRGRENDTILAEAPLNLDLICEHGRSGGLPGYYRG